MNALVPFLLAIISKNYLNAQQTLGVCFCVTQGFCNNFTGGSDNGGKKRLIN
jgi:hypothetical protein